MESTISLNGLSGQRCCNHYEIFLNRRRFVSTALAANDAATFKGDNHANLYYVSTALAANDAATKTITTILLVLLVSTALAANDAATNGVYHENAKN